MRGRAVRVPSGSFVEVPAGRVHVQDEGPADAPVVVLVHGFASSLHWFDRLAPLLTEDHRVIRVDNLGNGCTVSNGSDFGSVAQAEMMLSVLDALDVDTFAPFGHSFGSDVAIHLAEHSQRVERLGVIGQAPDYVTATFPPGFRLARHDVVARSVQALSALQPARMGGIGFARRFRADLAFDDPGQSGADLRACDPRTFRAVIVDRVAGFADRPLDVRLRDLGLPSLVVLGGRDQMYPLKPTRARYDAVPCARVEVIEHSGHSPNVEAPEVLAAVMRDFLG